MWGKIFGVLFLILGGIVWSVFEYLGFGRMLDDDIEVVSGKKAAKRRWKNCNGNFFSKLFYIGYVDEVKKWHYAIFLCYMVSYPLFLLSCILLVILGDIHILRYVMIVLFIIWFLPSSIAAFDRYGLYRENLVRPRPKKIGKGKQ